MVIGLLITFGYLAVLWVVFVKFKWLKFNMSWAVVSIAFGLHLLLIFLIGMRFTAPYSMDGKTIQQTIQLTPRLPEPTLVTEVLVKPNTPVKKGQPLFQFDRRPYQYQVNVVKAQLAAAKQQVRELKASYDSATATVNEAKAKKLTAEAALASAAAEVAEARAKKLALKSTLDEAIARLAESEARRDYAQDALRIAQTIKDDDAGAISQLKYDQAANEFKRFKADVNAAKANVERVRAAYGPEADAAINVALANEARLAAAAGSEADAAIAVAIAQQQLALLAYESQIDGVNTTVAQLEAELDEAKYYLEQTTMVAPADGYILNLQVQPGMVAGIVRVGAIATFVVDADRYVLATYTQEQLKNVKPGQPVEVAFDLYPGEIYTGKVQSIWQGSGTGQMVPSGTLPQFNPQAPDKPQGNFAVEIVMDDEDQSKFPIGAEGAVAIYTAGGGYSALRKIGIRARTWANYVYPLDL